MDNHTIAALSTPPGTSGIAVIRVSGGEAMEIVDNCFVGKIKLAEAKTHTIHYGIITYKDKKIDAVTASVFKSPNSYTGEDVVEISCHGNILVAGEIISILNDLGARNAEPGEFTRRAFLNGRLDLTQVEAVADIIHSVTIPGTQTAARQLLGEFTTRLTEFRQKLLDISSLLELELDFSDEDVEFVNKDQIADSINQSIDYCLNLADSYRSAEILRSGYFVAIAGYPNSGKSTLFNALLQRRRAIVSDIPGTTRDYLVEAIYLAGMAVRIIDTAGIRESEDIIEIEGIKMVESVLEQANLVLVINDCSISPSNSDTLINEIKNKYSNTDIILLQNKIDLCHDIPASTDSSTLFISASNSTGIDKLRQYIQLAASASSERVKDVLINQRQASLLRQAAADLRNALDALNNGLDNELVSIDIKSAAMHLGEITGQTWSEDVINNIFSRFCIGK